MPAFRCWAELPPDLLCRIGDSLDLKFYTSARGACTAWRCALAPPSPLLLVLVDYVSCCLSDLLNNARCCLSAGASLPTRRSFELKVISSDARCVGSSNSWLALSIGQQGMFSLFNPITATEIVLPRLISKSGRVSKIVFAPNPAVDDFIAAAICDMDRLAYVTAGAKRWAILDPVDLVSGDRLADVVYHRKQGRVYCVTRYGDVHVLRLPGRCRRDPFIVEDSAAPASAPAMSCTREGRRAALRFRRRRAQLLQDMFLKRSVGPDLNEPATLVPFLPDDGNLPFDLAATFAPPYNRVSIYTSAKHLVFCESNLYQIWRNASSTVTLKLPEGGPRRVAENEVFVLRYYMRPQPYWDVVTDLGGYSVFVGRNNAVSMFAQGVLGLKGNCVYWIDENDRDQGMVFDMGTGRSTPCLPAHWGSTGCWYFLSDMQQ